MARILAYWEQDVLCAVCRFDAEIGTIRRLRIHPMLLPADQLQQLFDLLPDVVFFVKDRRGRYTHANLSLVRRLGLKRRSEVIGRSTAELFPAPLGESYAAQDASVLAGEAIESQLELHLFPNRAPGWCLTAKQLLVTRGRIVGVVGISRDLGRPDERHPTYTRLKRVIDHINAHYAQAVRIVDLARLAGVSVGQLERHCQRVFQLSPRQLLCKRRIEAAMRLLREAYSIADIGLACGYADQSAFARQFKALVGLTPREYRAHAVANDVSD
jgi:AraC-like DNA-binding protein